MKQPIRKKERNTATPHVHFPLEAMAASTFFVNHTLQIEWVKADWRDRLSRAIATEWKEDDSGTIFDTLLHASLKGMFFNWQPLFSFVYNFLKQSTPPTIFNRVAPALSTGMGKTKTSARPLSGFKKVGLLDSCSFQVEDNDGKMQNKRLYGVVLSEGTVFVLNNETVKPTKMTTSTDLTGDSGKTPFSVLSVRLDNSVSIVDTLLPDAYYQLMKRIWRESDRVLAAFDGHRVRRSGTEVQYMIAGKPNRDPVYDAIRCAIDLRTKMRETEASLRADAGWYSRIRLNIGISSGKDHLQTEDPTVSMAFMFPGGAADQAHYLSTIARKGAIWITKPALSHIAPEKRKRITFGLYRKNRLIPNIFAQVSDLRHINGGASQGKQDRPMAVTRIISLGTA